MEKCGVAKEGTTPCEVVNCPKKAVTFCQGKFLCEDHCSELPNKQNIKLASFTVENSND
jgi:hypothetical protein